MKQPTISPALAAVIAAVLPHKDAAERHQRDVIDRPEHENQDESARMREVRDNNALNDAWCAATYAVAAHPVSTAADLHAKLAFMVDNDMGDGVDWLSEFLADAERVAAEAC